MRQEAEARELGERVGALVADDRPVGRQVAAGVALLAEDIEHAQDVLAHEDLAAGQVDLQVAFREGAAQGVERQLLAPLAFDVQQVADVAELARQVAAHGGLVDEARRQRIGAAGAVLDEAADRLLVPALAQRRVGAARERQRTGLVDDGAFQRGEERQRGSFQISRPGPGRSSAGCQGVSVLCRNGATRARSASEASAR